MNSFKFFQIIFIIASYILLIYCQIEVFPSDYSPPNLTYNKEINVHIIVHSHDDVGWLKTVDDYYQGTGYGWAASNCVKCIYNKMYTSLKANSTWNFNAVEMYFFERWYENELTYQQKQEIQFFINKERIYLLAGGAVMNDEANAYYDDVIVQMSYGHNFILKNFGKIPKIGWAIDPFGHSNGNAYLLQQFGFLSWHTERSHYQFFEKEKQNKSLQFIWESLPHNQIFTHVNYVKYGKEEFNIPDPSWAAKYAARFQEEASHFRTSEIFSQIGDDFTEPTIDKYRNYDTIMKQINANHDQYKINIFYSNPENYVKKVNEVALKQNIGFQLRTRSDIEPYYEKPFSIWTGYFTSRPELKLRIRNAGKMLQNIEKMLAVLRIGQLVGEETWEKKTSEQEIQSCRKELTLAVSIGQHHDAVTGTCQFLQQYETTEGVTQDYIKIINMAEQSCLKAISQIFNSKYSNYLKLGNEITMCSLNSTICELQTALNESLIILFNPSQEFQKLLKLKGKEDQDIRLFDVNGQQVIGQKICEMYQNQCEFYFETDLTPLKFKLFLVKSQLSEIKQELMTKVVFKEETIPMQSQPTEQNPEQQTQKINQNFTINISDTKYIILNQNNSCITYHYLENNVPVERNFEVNYQYYISYAGGSQNSGAYIMRLQDQIKQNLVNYQGDWSYQTGQQYLIYNILRKINDSSSDFNNRIVIETYFKSGQHTGKEMVITFNSKNINNQGLFYTDSNGLMMMPRFRLYLIIINFQKRQNTSKSQNEYIAENYYPVTSAIYIQDIQSQLRMTILNDRAQGGASIDDGEIELMFQRLMNTDDIRGSAFSINLFIVIDSGRGLAYRY